MGNRQWRAIAVLTSGLVGAISTVLVVEKRAELQQSDALKLPCVWPDRAVNNRHLIECKTLFDKSWNITLDGKVKIFIEEGPGVPTVKEAVIEQIAAYAGLPAQHYDTYSTKTNTDGLYYGKEPDPICQGAEQAKVGTVCDLGFQMIGNQNPEMLKNWRGDSCGQTAQLTLDGGALKVNLTPPLAGREAAYLLGARIQALKCHAADILGQLNRPGVTEIILRDPVAIQMAKDFNAQVFQQYETTYLALGLKKDDAIPLSCGWLNDNIKERMTGKNMKANPAIHVCALRALMASAFSRIIAYEVFARMQASYTNELLSAESQKAWAKELEDSIGTSCKEECGAAPANVCIQTCYDRKIGPLMKAKFDSLWPLPTYAGSDRWPTVMKVGAQCK